MKSEEDGTLIYSRSVYDFRNNECIIAYLVRQMMDGQLLPSGSLLVVRYLQSKEVKKTPVHSGHWSAPGGEGAKPASGKDKVFCNVHAIFTLDGLLT
jgi:hypothetical protein